MNYDDILDIENFHALGQPKMSRHDRAAQFMPFKSLQGYSDAILEEEASLLNEEWETVDYDV